MRLDIEAGLLGPLQLRVGGDALAPAGARQRACLALLLLARGRAVPAERLSEELWGEALPERGRASLQMQISRLRRWLSEAGLERGALVAEQGGYALAVHGLRLDADRFEQLLEAGRRRVEAADSDGGAAHLREALGLWRGGALEDAGDGPQVAAARARLEAVRLSARIELADAELRLGRNNAVISDLESLCDECPFDERPARPADDGAVPGR